VRHRLILVRIPGRPGRGGRFDAGRCFYLGRPLGVSFPVGRRLAVGLALGLALSLAVTLAFVGGPGYIVLLG